jgi:hypothetical protein
MEMHQLRSRYVPATLPDLQNGNVNLRQDHVTVWRWVQRYAPKNGATSPLEAQTE